MNSSRPMVALLLALLMFVSFSTPANGCGPSFIEPIFVFKTSPDVPFKEFAAGKIGIVREGFGRKTLVVAYRYLNNGTFGGEEQDALVEALKGNAPESDGTDAVKAWVAARKNFLGEGQKLPEIYTERQYGGYDFFPNCSGNAFAVATETLKARSTSYGTEDQNVRVWLAAQDTVFQNCGGEGTIPVELGAESPEWLRKDREYQVGAALLYSLHFDSARARFEKIAADAASPWQQTADYLVARTLIREASFAKEATRKRELYDQAETHLQILLAKGGKFSAASQRLIGLVKYRVHPQERVNELARVLETESGNENLRQDLIDYVWLLDKFETQIQEEEEAKRKATQGPNETGNSDTSFFSQQAKERYDALQHGEIINLTLDQKKPDGKPDYSKWVHLDFKPDTSEDEILQAFEVELRRKLTPEEITQIKEGRAAALESRKWRLSPNQNWAADDNERTYQRDEKLTSDQIPRFLRAADLTDWLFTFEAADQSAYAHAFSKWRMTNSTAWLVAALTKSQPSSRGVESLMHAGERVGRDAPAYASIAYHLVRLRATSGRKAEARKLLDDVISWQSEIFPTSAQNQFLEQRMQLATNLSEFLKFAPRRPAAFYEEGQIGKLTDFLDARKSSWSEDVGQTKEEYEKSSEDYFRELLPWDDRLVFEEKTVDTLNWHFPLQLLKQAASEPGLPDYLRRRLMLAVWTRAILLKNEPVAQKTATDIISLAPELKSLFLPYLKAQGDVEKQHAALYILLKQPMLSPFVTGGLPVTQSSEELDYYFETSWWCPLAETEYNDEANEVPKVISKPWFLTAEQFAAAAKERAALSNIGDAKSYLGKRVIEWARLSPADERLPEALFIAAKANGQYKYGCSGWEYDQPTRTKLETILREKYPQSLWAAKLLEVPE